MILTSRIPSFSSDSHAENSKIEPFDVEYYRTLSGGIPEQVFQTAMFVPALAKKKEKFIFKKA